jgi:hypothetical protein
MDSLLRIVAAAIRRRCQAVLVLAALALAPGAGFAQSPDPEAAGNTPTALVYVFRAMGGKFVTRDMDDLAAKIGANGFEVEVFNYTGWMRPAKDAIKRYRSETVKPRIIALGHSAGGDSAIRFALSLKRAQVPVDLIIALDPTRIANRVPANVARFINIYSSDHTFGGGDPTPAPDFEGHFASVDLKDYSDVWHLYMAKVTALQDVIVDKIVEVGMGAPPPPGESIAIEYSPPRDQPLELWDSGVAVVAGAGETAATVAKQFGVPPWVVADVNQVAADAPLAAGQRLVVPRHLAATPGPSN